MSDCSAELEKKKKAFELFEKAKEAEAAKQLDDAVRFYKAAFKLNPDLDRADVGEDGEDSAAGIPPEVIKYSTIIRDKVPEGFKTFDARKLLFEMKTEEGEGGDDDVEEVETEEAKKIRHYLNEFGYVVIDNVLDDTEIKQSLQHLSNWIGACGIDEYEKNPKKLLNSRIMNIGSGIVSRNAGSSKFNWNIRGNKKTKASFRAALNLKQDEKMISSFDGFNLIVNPECDSDGGGCEDSRGWLHTDSTSKSSSNYIQGLCNILDAQEPTESSFVVFPKSHKTFFDTMCPDVGGHPREGTGLHFLSTKDFKMMDELNIADRPYRVPMKAGSLVLWYSSTIHCNVGAQIRSESKINKQQIFRRIASYVCMMKDPKEAEVTERRMECLELGASTGHAPDYGMYSGASAKLKSSNAICTKMEELPVGAVELI